jgi:hypothetical protein
LIILLEDLLTNTKANMNKFLSENGLREDQVSEMISPDQSEMMKEWASTEEKTMDDEPWWDEEGGLHFMKEPIVRKWHGGTGGDKNGSKNYNKCLKTKLYPVGWKRWNKENPDKEDSRKGCKSHLLRFIESLGDSNLENRIYLHNTMDGRGINESVTHYGKATGKVYCNVDDSVKELLKDLPESFSENVIYSPSICGYNQPPGWSVNCHKVDSPRYGLPYKWGTFCLIEVEEWVKLKKPVSGAGSRDTIYRNSKTEGYPEN